MSRARSRKCSESARIDKYQRVEQFLSDIPLQVIDITDQIIEEGKTMIGKKLNDSILLTLADHIHFALDRFKKGVDVQNPLHWDIRHLYPAEYHAGELGSSKNQ